MLTISFTNNKGGVGKTTSSIAMAYFCALQGKKTLLIDMDPQGNATSSLIDKSTVSRTIKNAFQDKKIEDCIVTTNENNLYLIPANLTLDEANILFSSAFRREEILKKLLKKIENKFEICIVDTAPTLSLLTFNALVASDSIYIPVKTGGYELEGMRNLINIISEISEKKPGIFFNQYQFNALVASDSIYIPVKTGGYELEGMRNLINIISEISEKKPGIFFNQYQSNQAMSKNIKEEIEKEFSKTMMNHIRQNNSLREAALIHESIFNYSSDSNGAVDYEKLCQEIFEREGLKIKKIRKKQSKNDIDQI